MICWLLSKGLGYILLYIIMILHKFVPPLKTLRFGKEGPICSQVWLRELRTDAARLPAMARIDPEALLPGGYTRLSMKASPKTTLGKTFARLKHNRFFQEFVATLLSTSD